MASVINESHSWECWLMKAAATATRRVVCWWRCLVEVRSSVWRCTAVSSTTLTGSSDRCRSTAWTHVDNRPSLLDSWDQLASFYIIHATSQVSLSSQCSICLLFVCNGYGARQRSHRHGFHGYVTWVRTGRTPGTPVHGASDCLRRGKRVTNCWSSLACYVTAGNICSVIARWSREQLLASSCSEHGQRAEYSSPLWLVRHADSACASTPTHEAVVFYKHDSSALCLRKTTNHRRDTVLNVNKIK